MWYQLITLPIFIVIISIRPWQWWLSVCMKIIIPIDGKDGKEIKELVKDQRLRSSIQQHPVSLESIKNENFNAYIDKLHGQYKYSDSSTRDFIARIQFTEQGQYFYSSISTGWYNNFSITLIAHKKYNDYHKIVVSKLSKEVTLPLLSKIKSAISMTLDDHKQMETILTGVNSKQTIENVMMYIMADNLHN